MAASSKPFSINDSVLNALKLVSERDINPLLNHSYKNQYLSTSNTVTSQTTTQNDANISESRKMSQPSVLDTIKDIVPPRQKNLNTDKHLNDNEEKNKHNNISLYVEEGKPASLTVNERKEPIDKDEEIKQVNKEKNKVKVHKETNKVKVHTETNKDKIHTEISNKEDVDPTNNSESIQLPTKSNNLILGFNPNPPNGGEWVTSIDQLVDPAKMSNIMGMFNSMPELKKMINPDKFKSINADISLKLNTKNHILNIEPVISNSVTNLNDDEASDTLATSALAKNGINGSGQFNPILEIIEDEIDLSLVVEDRPEIEQNWTVKDIVTKATPPGWKNVFDFAKNELEHINIDLIKEERQYGHFYPLKKDLFKAFDMCPLRNVKVVIMGQDPYHSTNSNGYPNAMGMSFSVSRGSSIPPSLRNIYKELSRSIPEFKIPDHGDLSGWLKQGVLMLNSCLTVRKGQAKSHKNLWMGFISTVIKAINENNPHCIYVLWGKEAEKITNFTTNKNVILTAPHPSGLSAHRGFLGCGHFVEINKHLESQGRLKIDWNLKP